MTLVVHKPATINPNDGIKNPVLKKEAALLQMVAALQPRPQTAGLRDVVSLDHIDPLRVYVARLPALEVTRITRMLQSHEGSIV